MLLPHRVRSVLRFATLVGGIASTACADGVQRVGEGEVVSQGIPAAAGRAISRAPADTVDSLTAVRRATVMDKTPIGPRPVPRPVPDTSAPRDSARPRVPAPLGSRSGNRHPAFGDTGSPL